MRPSSLLFILLLEACGLLGQSTFKVLHYTETSGFDHNTRQNSLAMFQAIGQNHNFTIDQDNTGAAFNTLSNLQQYAVIIFSNTSGDALLNATQRSNFEAYINGGGAFVGIHAASDTYRHSTANGGATGAWDWYAELLGASVRQSPNHVAGTPSYNLNKIGTHPSTDSLPNPWIKNEEYYYWESGYYNDNNIPVLEVEQTIGPNNQVNSYDTVRPMSWYKYLPSGGRSFYTALGHDNSNFTNDLLFRAHLRDAVLWAANRTTSIPKIEQLLEAKVYQCQQELYIEVQAVGTGAISIQLSDVWGKSWHHSQGPKTTQIYKQGIAIADLPRGIYVVTIQLGKRIINRKVLIQKNWCCYFNDLWVFKLKICNKNVYLSLVVLA